MKFKSSLFLLLLALTRSAEAISFRDYYHGNESLSIPPHEKEINDEVATGSLDLRYTALTDLVGFDEVPGLAELRRLSLSNNELATLPDNIFHGLSALKLLSLNDNRLATLPANAFRGLTALESLYLYNNQLTAFSPNIINGLTSLEELDLENNPIPLTQAQLELQLPDSITLSFKTPKQEQAEWELFVALENADVLTFRCWLDEIMTGVIHAAGMIHIVPNVRIVVSKIRNPNGDNLLHAAIRAAAERIKVIDGMSVGLPEAEKKAVKEIQAEQKAEINDRYMKIISEILSCGEQCVEDMLFTPNAEGQQVVDAVVAKLGFDSPITQAILFVLSPEESRELHSSASCSSAEKKEKKEQHEAQK